MLDRSAPGQPAFLAAGTYAITVNWVATTAPDVTTGIYTVSLFVDQFGTGNTLTTAQDSSCAAPLQAGAALTAIAVAGAGDYFFAPATNVGSVASRDFTLLDATVTKLF